MSKFGTLIMGPAGAGKTTFCNALIQHLRINRRSCFYVNLDPAAENFENEPDLDIKDLISLEDVMEDMHLGPNGGLIQCFEFLMENLDFLSDAIEPLTEEYLIVFDMPGQIELYTHIPILPELVRYLGRSGSLNINLCAAYLLESTFVIDKAKYFAGTLSAMSAMILLEIPHINILSKMDRIRNEVGKRHMKRFLDPDSSLLDEDDVGMSGRVSKITSETLVVPAARTAESGPFEPNTREASFANLNRAVAKLIDDFSLVSYLQLDVQKEDSVGAILSYIDDAIQFHEAQEPREPKEEDYGD